MPEKPKRHGSSDKIYHMKPIGRCKRKAPGLSDFRPVCGLAGERRVMEAWELYKYENDKQRLRSLQLELAQHEAFNPFRPSGNDGMPHGSGDGTTFAEIWTAEKLRIEGEIRECQAEAEAERMKLERLLEQIPEPERSVVRYRVINGLTWDKIGRYTHMNRTTAMRKFRESVKKIKKF